MIRYTAQCLECQANHPDPAVQAPLLYDSERERDEEVNKHVDMSGHAVAVGYIDTEEHKPNRKERRHNGS